MVQSRHRQILRHSAARRFLHSDRSSLAQYIVEISRGLRPENHAGVRNRIERLLTALITALTAPKWRTRVLCVDDRKDWFK